jgi:hypothetical protein
METIIIGTHEYQWALHPLAHLYQRYWSNDQLLWYGDRVEGPLPDNVEFRQVPAFGEGEWPWDHHFGRGLISILQALRDDVVCILLPDHWLSAGVDRRAVHTLERYMRTNKVLRGNLTAGTCLDQHGVVVKSYRRYDVVGCAPTDHHCSFGGGLTFCPSLWSREGLLRLLEPGWSLWESESVGTQKFARMMWVEGWTSVGIVPAPVKRCHGLSRAAPKAANLAGLAKGDREAVAAMLPDGWEAVGV